MPTNEEITQVFPKMMDSFQPEKAEGLNALIQFDLSGDNGGLYWIKIAGGAVEHGQGPATNPAMTLKTSADDFHALVNGNLNPMQAFMMGKIKVTDVGLAMKMMNAFKLG